MFLFKFPFGCFTEVPGAEGGSGGSGGDSGVSSDGAKGGSETQGGAEGGGASTGVTDGTDNQTVAGSGEDKSQKKYYTDEDVSNIVSKRLKEDRSRKLMDRMVNITGLSAEEIERRLEVFDRERQQKALADQAKESGISAQVLQQINAQQTKLQQLERLNQVNQMLSNQTEYPGFAEIQDDVIKESDNLNIPLDKAYWIVAGKSRLSQTARETEQRLINQRQKLSGKDRVQGDDSSQIGVSSETIPEDVVAMAKHIGMDPEEYYASMNATNIDDWRAYKSKKKK